MLTLPKLNKEIRPFGYRLIKDDGRFYFWKLTNEVELRRCSVYVDKINDLTLYEWKEELRTRIDESC